MVYHGFLLIYLRFCHLYVEMVLFLSDLDVFYFHFLPNCSAQNFQYYVEYKWQEWAFCLFTDLRGKDFKFLLLSMILDVGLSFVAFIMLRYVNSISCSLTIFIMNGCWILSNFFSASVEIIFVFYLMFIYIILINLWMLNYLFTLEVNSTHRGCMILLMYF